MAAPKLEELEFGDSWTGAEGTLDGKPILVRLRSEIEPLFAHPQLANLLRIVWEFPVDGDSGLPDVDTLDQMSQCEDALVGALELQNHAILAHVLTCDGLRQWVFYTSDVEESASRINEALPQDPPYPIELTVDSDPEWCEHRELRDNTLQSE